MTDTLPQAQTPPATPEAPQLPNGYYLQLGAPEEEMHLLDLWYAITSRKLIIFLVVLAFTALGGFIAWVLPMKWKGVTTVSVVPQSKTTTTSTPTTTAPPSVDLNMPYTSDEILGYIQGRDFLYRFINKYNLLPILFEKDWNKDKKTWEMTTLHRWIYGDSISIWDGYTKLYSILSVSTDDTTNLTTVTLTWTDNKLAAEWSTNMVKMLNQELQQKAIKESEAILAELNNQLKGTSILQLQQSIYGLMETQMAKIASARVHPDYGMVVVDSAVVEDDQSIPYLQLILVVVSMFLGIVMALALVLLLHTLSKQPARPKPAKRRRKGKSEPEPKSPS